jgi:alginate O-acetyltransferase complex protein AlgI
MPLATPINWPPWVVMWALAVGIFIVCKWMTWRGTPTPPAPAWRHLAYLFAWPGLDAKAFLDLRPLAPERRPTSGEWVFATGKTTLGGATLCGAVPILPVDLPLLRGWVGMAGLVFILHFGTFHLLSSAWRSAGVDAKPLMNWPVRSESLSEFWGKRWNTAFRDLTHRYLFRPLAARLGPRVGLAAGFLFSGVVHDLVISVPAGGGYSWPTLYFVIQGIGLLAERSRTGKRLGLGSGWRGRVFTAVVVAGPAYGLFHPPFVLNVVLPFLDAIGAM